MPMTSRQLAELVQRAAVAQRAAPVEAPAQIAVAEKVMEPPPRVPAPRPRAARQAIAGTLRLSRPEAGSVEARPSLLSTVTSGAGCPYRYISAPHVPTKHPNIVRALPSKRSPRKRAKAAPILTSRVVDKSRPLPILDHDAARAAADRIWQELVQSVNQAAPAQPASDAPRPGSKDHNGSEFAVVLVWTVADQPARH